MLSKSHLHGMTLPNWDGWRAEALGAGRIVTQTGSVTTSPLAVFSL